MGRYNTSTQSPRETLPEQHRHGQYLVRYNTSTQSPRENLPDHGRCVVRYRPVYVYTSIQTTQRTERNVKTRSDTQIEHTITPTARDDSVSRFRSLSASAAVLHVVLHVLLHFWWSVYGGRSARLTWLGVWRRVLVFGRLRHGLLQLGGVDAQLRVHPLLEQGQLLTAPYRVPET